MQDIILVGCGGFMGAAMRYILSGWLQKLVSGSVFPLGTLGVNVLGCLCIGLMGGYAENVQLFAPPVRLFFMIGLLGGFTTFSTFGYETLSLMRDGELFRSFISVLLHLALGLGAVWLGYAASLLRG
jgi:CrcB protein